MNATLETARSPKEQAEAEEFVAPRTGETQTHAVSEAVKDLADQQKRLAWKVGREAPRAGAGAEPVTEVRGPVVSAEKPLDRRSLLLRDLEDFQKQLAVAGEQLRTNPGNQDARNDQDFLLAEIHDASSELAALEHGDNSTVEPEESSIRNIDTQSVVAPPAADVGADSGQDSGVPVPRQPRQFGHTGKGRLGSENPSFASLKTQIEAQDQNVAAPSESARWPRPPVTEVDDRIRMGVPSPVSSSKELREDAVSREASFTAEHPKSGFDLREYWQKQGANFESGKDFADIAAEQREKARQTERAKGEIRTAERVAVTLPNGLKFEGSPSQVDAYLTKFGFAPAVEKPAEGDKTVAQDLARKISATHAEAVADRDSNPLPEEGAGAVPAESASLIPAMEQTVKSEKPSESPFSALWKELSAMKPEAAKVTEPKKVGALQKIRNLFASWKRPAVEIERDVASIERDMDQTKAQIEASVPTKKAEIFSKLIDAIREAGEKQLAYDELRQKMDRRAGELLQLTGENQSLSMLVKNEEERNRLLGDLLGKISTLESQQQEIATKFDEARTEYRQALQVVLNEAMRRQGKEADIITQEFKARLQILMRLTSREAALAPTFVSRLGAQEDGSDSNATNVVRFPSRPVAAEPLTNPASGAAA